MREAKGTLALVGGGEWTEGCRAFDQRLLEASGGGPVLVLPTAAAYEHPGKAVERAAAHFAGLGADVEGLMVIGRRQADDPANAVKVRAARFVYLSGGSSLHLRSVFKGSAVWEAVVDAFREGAVLAASGAAATVLCDPMVDPRGGAYTVGLGLLANVAVVAEHDTVPEHLKERALDLLPDGTTLIGIDCETALLREPGGHWSALGAGKVIVYGPSPKTYTAGPVDAITL